MKKCKYAKGCQNEVIWYMQFVGEEKPSFYFPGYHIRGFKVIPVCDQHMEEEVNRQHDTAQSSEAIEHTLAHGQAGTDGVNNLEDCKCALCEATRIQSAPPAGKA